MSHRIHPNRRPQRRERLWNTAACSSETPAVFASGTTDRLNDLVGGESEAIPQRPSARPISVLVDPLRVGEG